MKYFRSSNSRMAVRTLFGLGLLAEILPAQAGTCEYLTTLSLPHAKVSSANVVAATDSVPEYCLVEAHSYPSADSDIKILVGLPTASWNGKYLQLGNAGFGGAISPPTSAIQQGYAGAATDDGHQGSPFDGQFALGHPERVIDFGYRALKETTDIAKTLITTFYGRNPKYSYFSGCSDGGREALVVAQRFPQDWDGIIAGASANFWTHQMAGYAYNAQVLADSPLPAAKLPAIQAAVLAKCDASDGLVDGLVSNPHRCHFRPSTMLCKAGTNSNNCLTPDEARTVRRIMDGPRDPRTGESIFPGFSFAAPVDFGLLASWIYPQPQYGFSISPQATFARDFYKYMVFDDSNFDFLTLNFTTDIEFADAKLASTLNATNPDLHRLKARGAKVIMYHGYEDPAVAPQNSINYYESVAKAHRRGEGDVDDFFRLFMVPGMGHCSGGPGPNTFDALGALSKWVEKREAPDRIIATKYTGDVATNPVERTRPLCPYPQEAIYKGTGSTNDAANFVCGKPRRDD